jgi:hypothetical protein
MGCGWRGIVTIGVVLLGGVAAAGSLSELRAQDADGGVYAYGAYGAYDAVVYVDADDGVYDGDAAAGTDDAVAPSAGEGDEPSEADATADTSRTTPAVLTAPRAAAGDLRDGFDDPAAGALPTESEDPAVFRVAYEGGEYVVATLDPTFDGFGIARLPGTYADAALAVDARLADEVAGGHLNLGCRTTAAGGYQLSVVPAYGQFTIVRWDGDAPTVLAEWAAAEAIRGGTETNRLELSCVGATVSARINGAEVGSVRDDRHAQGAFYLGAGVFAEAQPGTVEARFDDLHVVLKTPS